MLSTEFRGAEARFRLDVAPVHADRSCLDYGDAFLNPRYRVDPRPHEPAFLLHMHGVIWHPTMTEAEIGKVLKEYFPGQRQFCFSKAVPDSDDGCSGGLQGWGEYAGMEKSVLTFDDDDPAADNVAVQEMLLRIRKSFGRKSRTFQYNDRQKSDGGDAGDDLPDPVSDDPEAFCQSDPVETRVDAPDPETPSCPYNCHAPGDAPIPLTAREIDPEAMSLSCGTAEDHKPP